MGGASSKCCGKNYHAIRGFTSSLAVLVYARTGLSSPSLEVQTHAANVRHHISSNTPNGTPITRSGTILWGSVAHVLKSGAGLHHQFLSHDLPEVS